MVSTRKTPSERTTMKVDGSAIIEAIDDEDDTINIMGQSSVGFLPFRLFLYIDFLDTTQFYPARLRHHLR